MLWLITVKSGHTRRSAVTETFREALVHSPPKDMLGLWRQWC